MIAKIATTAALLAVASPAFAASIIGDTPGPNDAGPPPGLTTVVDFDSPDATGVVNTTTGNVYEGPDTVANEYARPANSPGNYQAVQTGGSSTFDFTSFYGDGRAVGKFSLYWGSIDTYNTLTFLDGSGNVVKSYTGFDFPPANGNQPGSNTNRRITFGFTTGENVRKVEFTSSQNAFEYDTLAIAGVPEPATWAMMILGFGLVGGAMRSRKAVTTKVAYA